MYVQGTNLTTVSRHQYDEMNRVAVEAYPTWPDTVEFVQGVRQRILEDTEDEECNVLKNMLVSLEHEGSGRVRLQEFYGGALAKENWQFVESVPYLRELGALDESNPDQPAVIIPNYLNSPANC